MKSLTSRPLFALLFAGFFLSSCSNRPCNRGVICTDILTTVMTQVDYKTDIKADDIYTLNTETGEKIHYPQTSSRITVLDDSYLPKMKNRTVRFKLVGTDAGVAVFEEEYVISADCCHINKKTGKDLIVVE